MPTTSTSEAPPPRPISFRSIVIVNAVYRIWTERHQFHYDNYFVVLAVLQELESQPDWRTPTALPYLEQSVHDFLLSPKSLEDKRRFELLLNPDRETKNERLIENLELLLDDMNEGFAARKLVADLVIRKKGYKIDQQHRESARQCEDEVRRKAEPCGVTTLRLWRFRVWVFWRMPFMVALRLMPSIKMSGSPEHGQTRIKAVR